MPSTPDTGVRASVARTPQEDLAFSDRWGRSIERSRTRRIAGAVKRRRRFRSRGAMLSLTAVMAMSAIGAGAAVGQTGGTTLITQGSQGDQVSAVQSALGVSQTGTYDSATARAVRAFQGENGLVVDGIVGPETSAALGLGGAAPAGDGSDRGNEASGGASPELEAIAQCESGGDPSAVSSDGQFRGKYQFSRETWAGVGGTGDPAAAPESVQDELAAQLYAQSGTSPWPNCG